MKPIPFTAVTYAFLLGLLYPYVETGQFYGGSMSYVMEKQPDGNQLVIIELITGWVLGKGPCGITCNKNDIGRSTRSTRPTVVSTNPYYLGNFTKEFKVQNGPKKIEVVDIRERVRSTYNETVIAMSEHGKWEQEIMHFSVIMEQEKKEIDISFEGDSWRTLSYQNSSKHGFNPTWHFQTKIVSKIRSDTNRTNRSPKSMAKPYYRIKLGNMSEIRIPAVDADNDFLKCEIGKDIEARTISVNPPPYVNVMKNCSVYINATLANGYRDNTWIAVPVSVRDYNKKDIIYGAGNYISGRNSLSTTAVQILANLTIPEFVDPTYTDKHTFIMYSGAEWRTQIYAEATENTTIAEFLTFGMQGENLLISNGQQDPKRPQVKFALMSWQPSITDVGGHIACVSVTDDTGVDSEQRCFILDVQADAFNHSSTFDSKKPYFIDIPSPDQFVDCKIQATCVVAIYVKSNITVSEIHVTDSFIDKYQVGPIQYIMHNNKMVYKADLSFEHSVHGKENICFKAKDVNGVESETVCITSHIEPPDPCLSAPCKNSAPCEVDKDTGGFKCHCMSGFSGRICENRTDDCHPNPCLHEAVCYITTQKGANCFCRPHSGLTGDKCETSINDCKNNSCNGNGRCIDGLNNFTCECFDQYHGNNCTDDHCPTQRYEDKTCPANGCNTTSCNSRGICSAGGSCDCPSGYSGLNCETPKCTMPGTVSGIFSPSPKDRSTLTCHATNDKKLSCNMRVYVTAMSSSVPKITTKTTEELNGIIAVGPAKKSSDLPGISPVYSVDIIIDGTMNSTKSQYVCINAEYMTSNSSVCYGISIVSNPEDVKDSQAFDQKDAKVKFVQPTLKDKSRIICTLGTKCHILLYTTIVSQRPSCKMTTSSVPGGGSSVPSDSCDIDDIDNDVDDTDQGNSSSPCCQDVISTTNGVKVYRAHPRGPSCVTEASIVYTSPGEKEICFQSGYSDYQQLCYKVGVYADKTDPCYTSPCQNNGHCLHTSHDNYTCVCPDKYVGTNCEQGPCQVRNCQNDAYCQRDNGKDTCICKAGYSGSTCNIATSGLPSTSNTFTDTAKPTVFPCVLNQKCSFALFVSVQSGQTPIVSPGYVDPSLHMEEIETVKVPLLSSNQANSYQANIQVKAKQLGLKVVCIQTKDNNGVNIDELCTQVNVVSDVISLYTFKDRPHFVEPSLPMDAEVECLAEDPCHVLYHVTPGAGNENECVTFKATPPAGFVNYFLYSSCDTCKPGESTNGNCTVDVSVVNTIADKDTTRKICLSVGLKGSSVEGEERCFDIMIKDKTTVVKKGCQKLECKHGGFCDGHDSDNPVCFCSKAFSGTNCDQVKVESPMTGTQISSFLGDLTVPSEVKCVINEACIIPFQVISKQPGYTPSVSLGFNDPRLSVMPPSFKQLGSSTTTFQGKVVATPNTIGDFTFCLQATGNSKTEDELCVMVDVIGTPTDKLDTTKPYFLSPTLSADSTVICVNKKACHFDMHFTSGDMFAGFSGVCPTLNDKSSSTVTGLHIFDVHKENNTMCSGDVTYVPPQADGQHQLCFQVSLPGKKGETRCYTVKVVTDINKEVISPCREVKCEHNGKCLADFNETPAKYLCICTSAGFDGKHCQNAITQMTDLPGISNLNGTVSGNQHFEGNSGIPTEIQCESNTSSECCINTPYIGMKSNPPILGYKDSELTISTQTVLEIGSTDLTKHIAQTCIKVPPTGGPYKICQQTTSNGTAEGVNIDEICTKISVQPKRPKNNTVSPHFSTNIPDGSTVLCKPNKICHNQIFTEKLPSGKCSQARECGTGVSGVHFFETKLVDNLCITDLALKTIIPGTLDLCISAGSGGEQQHLKVEVKSPSSFGPCQGLHCLNGGSCIAASSAKCECLAGYTGNVCETDIDECKSNPCKNGATCIDKVNAFQCSCAPGYTNTTCDVINGCDANPCKNGTCVDVVNNYTCTCVYGYTGRNCNEVSPTTTASTTRTTTTELTTPTTTIPTTTTPTTTTPTTTTPTTTTPTTTTPTTTIPTTTTLTTTTPTTTIPTTTTPTTTTTTTTTLTTTTPTTTTPTITTPTTTTPTTTTPKTTISTTTIPTTTTTKTTTPTTNTPTTTIPTTTTPTTTTPTTTTPTTTIPTTTTSTTTSPTTTTPTTTTPTTTATTPSTTTTPTTTTPTTTTPSTTTPTITTLTTTTTTPTTITFSTTTPPTTTPTTTSPTTTTPTTTTSATTPSATTTPTTTTPTTTTPTTTTPTTTTPATTPSATTTPTTTTPTTTPTTTTPTTTTPTTMSPLTTTLTTTTPPTITPKTATDFSPICQCVNGKCSSNGCICYEGWSGSICEKVGGIRTHPGLKTNQDNSPPAFTEYVIPEIIPCKINKPCNIMLPVDGKPSPPPSVEHGDSDPGLKLTSPIKVERQGKVPCDPTELKCAYEATITVSPTELKLYKYCVKTKDYNSIPADELCYKIEGVQDDTNPPGMFSYPPTLPENSTMSCSFNQTCHYQLAIKKKNPGDSCNQTLNVQPASSEVHVLPPPPVNQASDGLCHYDVVYIPSKEASGKQNFCVSPTSSPNAKHCMVVDVTEKCDTKKASQEAREMVTKGYASCFCVVNQKKVQIIKKRPVAQKNKLFKAAGFGAGAVTGTMVLGVVVYFIVNKVRQPSIKRKPPTPRPASPSSTGSARQKSRVHPQGRTGAN